MGAPPVKPNSGGDTMVETGVKLVEIENKIPIEYKSFSGSFVHFKLVILITIMILQHY